MAWNIHDLAFRSEDLLTGVQLVQIRRHILVCSCTEVPVLARIRGHTRCLCVRPVSHSPIDRKRRAVGHTAHHDAPAMKHGVEPDVFRTKVAWPTF